MRCAPFKHPVIVQQGAHGITGDAQQRGGAQLIETAKGKSLAHDQVFNVMQQGVTQLQEQAARFANFLLAQGVKRGDKVAGLLPCSRHV